MAFKTYDHSQNYTAQVIKLPVKQPVQGLDNLVEVNVFGNSCLISKDSNEDVLYLFFPAGCQLSEQFTSRNNLYREFQLNADPNIKGFFELNRRVKAIKFRGIISTGFVIPVSSLSNMILGEINLTVGDSFNEFQGFEICRKYQLPTNTQSQVKGDKVSKINNRLLNLLVPNQFRFHTETNHLANNLHKLNHDDIIVVTDKWHGSSCILSKVYVSKKLTLWQKFLNLIGGKIPNKEYGYIYSSGKPKSNLPKGIEGEWINDGIDYYTANIWKRAFDDFKAALEDGISLYGELVGYTESGQFIQKGYDYGCCPDCSGPVQLDGSYRFVVYRITYTKPDGNVIEFSWQQIKDYCTKWNLEHVKELYFGRAGFINPNNILTGTNEYDEVILEEWRNAVFEKLQTSFNLEKKCSHCTTGVPAEGLGVRIDGRTHYNTFKLKAKLFLKKESDDLDKGETNLEDNA
jgi:hypothetical protein